MGGWLDHKQLKIVKGVYAAPGDNKTAEFPLVVLNLMDDTAGMALDGSRPWSPGIASVEGSGIWSDSPLSVGRYPLVMNDGNVTEKISVILTGSTPTVVFGRLKALHQIALDARAFWTDNAQIQPVFLHWWASCGAGPQYALIYNIDIDQQFVDGVTPTILVTLAIEREPYWRWLPPGANPRQWSYEFNSRVYQTGLNSTFLHSNDGFHLITGSVSNKSEFALNTYTNPLRSDNSVTIPANYIPGDAPALLEFFDDCNAGGINPRYNIIVGKKTIKILMGGNAAQTIFIPQNTIFNAADGTLGTDATITADTGAPISIPNVGGRRVEISFATATNQLRWRSKNTTDNAINAFNRFIGRWMVFLRCRQSAGSVGDISMYLRYSTAVTADTDGTKMNVVSPPVIAGTGNSTDWGLVYMGAIQLPFRPGTAAVTDIGFGLDEIGLPFDFGLFATRTAGAGLLYLSDLILIPIDEGSIQLETIDASNYPGQIYDETGFSTHGTPDLFALCGSTAASVGPDKVFGTGIQLTPNIENRLYFIHYDGSLFSRVTDTFNVFLNIIPRSRGIRDIANLIG